MKHILLLLVTMACGWNLQAETVVYLKTGGTGNGATPTTPTGSLNTAYKAVEDAGGEGTIVIVDKFTLTAAFARNIPKSDNITITSKYNDVDYRDGNANCVIDISKGLRWTLYRPTSFENITFSDAGVSAPYILFVANFHPITMGEGIEVNGFPTTEIATALTILGGAQSGQTGAPATNDVNPNITVKSGKFIVIGFSRQMDATYTGTAQIVVSGGNVHNIYCGNLNSGLGGSVNLTVSGGKIVGNIYACSTNSSRPNYASGTATLTFTGGNWNELHAIYGNMDGLSQVDLSNHAHPDSIVRRMYYFDKYITTEGEVPFLTPKEVFESAVFTDNENTDLPYRIYFPEGYSAEKTYPVLLYMHGNGSRGSDNEKHLSDGSDGSGLLSRILNWDKECILVAPQCPSESEWVRPYPGNAEYASPEVVPMGAYLSAAKSLLDYVLATYSVDKERVYIYGASNGGGATWDLLARFPDLFAAGIPICGNGESSNASAVAGLYVNTPIWTFHGDADETLSVDGTRGMVEAIRAANGDKIIYTELPGKDHNIGFDVPNVDGIPEWLFAQKKDLLTGISEKVLNPIHISVNGKMLQIVAAGFTDISVYNLSGAKLFHVRMQGEQSFALAKGAYIVKTNQGVSKIIV
ncbi:MAG: prolyl oligopeptidase family serine peptidase [Candidatus Symbiothrix sp.]|jgi:acetyl esterase/lipase|nr:prolyl oligopeptidase family serine peptidase [Candidatus Symbiothrix sp.]